MLCIENDPLRLRVLVALLADADTTLETVPDQAQAIHLIEAQSPQPDVVVIHESLLSSSGSNLVTDLAQADFDGRVVVIGISPASSGTAVDRSSSNAATAPPDTPAVPTHHALRLLWGPAHDLQAILEAVKQPAG